MDTPKPGTYGCVRTGGFYAWLIRVGTRSEYNHAFIVHTGGRIIESDPGGARWSTLDAYAGHEVMYCPDYLDDATREKITAKAETLLGTPYGWLDIARLSLRCLGVQWKWLTTAADNEKSMICSQLVAACGEAGRVDWNCGREAPAAVTPGDLAARIGG